jgi:hypothetical protein
MAFSGRTNARATDRQTRDKDYPQVGATANRLFGQRHARHVRHTDLADHQAQGGMFVEQDERLSAALRLEDPVSGVNLRIPTMPSRHTELKASTGSDLMPSTVLR